MKGKTNPVARSLSTGKQGKPATHRAAKGGGYRRHPKHKKEDQSCVK